MISDIKSAMFPVQIDNTILRFSLRSLVCYRRLVKPVD